MSPEPLTRLLAECRPDLVRYVERHAGAVLRYETAEDLVQGVHVLAIERAHGFSFRSRKETLAWVYVVARGYLRNRREHWGARKRRPDALLRLTAGASTTSDPGAVREPAHARTGPVTAAARREQNALARRALDLLLPRDRILVQARADGRTAADAGARLGLTPDAAQRATQRALTRFRRIFHRLAEQRIP
jgi:RNA polymerase sigma factor (sigma-70 family)